MFYYRSFPVIDANQAESTSNTSAIIGGVVAVAVAFIIITSLTVTVVVILVLRSRSGKNTKNKARPYTLTLIWRNNYVIVFDTELQLELQINQWSSPGSQSQHMRKSPHIMKHCEMISIPLMASLQRSRPAPNHQKWGLQCSERDWKDSWTWLWSTTKSSSSHHLSTYRYCCRLWTSVTVGCTPSLEHVAVWTSVAMYSVSLYTFTQKGFLFLVFTSLRLPSWASFLSPNMCMLTHQQSA